jgi:hypothetical protein
MAEFLYPLQAKIPKLNQNRFADARPGPLQTFATTITLVTPGQSGSGDRMEVPNANANHNQNSNQPATAEQQVPPIDANDQNNTNIIIGASIGTVAGLAIITIPLCMHGIRQCRSIGAEEADNALSKIWEAGKETDAKTAAGVGIHEKPRAAELHMPFENGGNTKPAAAPHTGVEDGRRAVRASDEDTFSDQFAARRARAGTHVHTTNPELDAEGVFITVLYSPSPRNDGCLGAPSTISVDGSHDEVRISIRNSYDEVMIFNDEVIIDELELV